MAKVLIQSSGSEANDTAVKIVWYYWNALGKPEKRKIIYREGSYHGATIVTTALCGGPVESCTNPVQSNPGEANVSIAKKNVSGLMTAVAGVSLLVSGASRADDREVVAARAGIQASIDKLLDSIRKGGSAEEAAKLWYTDDLTLSLTGGKYWHDLASFMPTLKEWVAYPLCDWKLDDQSVRASGKMAAAFVIETCSGMKAGDPPMVMRSLYVFRKTPAGWRATHEAITQAP
jgi:ketosteroid isomerase-like protein